MKKKLFITILFLIMCIGCMYCFSACTEPHDHYFKMIENISPTCQTDGKITYECDICGEKKEVVLSKSEHTYGEQQIINEATCTENGIARFICTVCGYTNDEVIVAEGHDYKSVEAEKATCQKSGQLRHTCTKCGDSYIEVIPAIDHSYDNGIISTAATCTQPGVKTFTCTMCSNIFTQAISATGHSSDSGTVLKQATCTETGNMVYHCKVCGEEIRTAAIAALGHRSDNGTVTVEATCTQSGEKIFNCVACGIYIKKEVVPAIGHKLTDIGNAIEATCQHEGKTAGSVCTLCKEVLAEQKVLAVADHKFEFGKCIWCNLEKQFTITFKANGETIKSATFTVSTKSVDEPEVPYVEGYEKGGWESYTLGFEDLTVNAIYTAKNYTLMLEPGEGVLSENNVKVTFGNTYTLPVPIKTGYDFVGWFDSVEDDAARYTDADGVGIKLYAIAADKALYAKWTVKKLLVTFDTNGGTAISSKQYIYGDKFKVDDIPINSGLTFDGWYSQDGSVEYTADTEIRENLTVYAKWIDSIAISTADQLIAIAQAPEKNYHLTNDIDLKASIWSPVSTFSGKLNGKGYKIKSFILNTVTPGNNYGFISINNGIVENLTFDDFTFKVSATAYSVLNLGVLAGKNSGSVINCLFTNGTIKYDITMQQTQEMFSIGSVVGSNTGTVSKCYSYIDMEGTVQSKRTAAPNKVTDYFRVGGLVGDSTGLIIDCIYKAAITVKSSALGYYYYHWGVTQDYFVTNIVYLGGVVGSASSQAVITKCKSEVTINYQTIQISNGEDRACIGGLIGGNNAKIASCYSTGEINGGATSGNSIGGLAGDNYVAQIESCYSSVNINANQTGSIGGLVGDNSSVIQSSYASGDVIATANSNVGGFAGSNSSAGTISKCYSTGDVNTVGGNIGHFVGINSGVVFKCYFMQGATLISSGKYIDQIVEYNSIEGKLYSSLWSEEFLVDELYWEADGWIIIVDENPLLQWEIEVSHNFRTMVVEPTCEYGGFTIYSCADCDRLFVKDFIDPLGHEWQDVGVIPATCKVDGYTLQHCVRGGCGEERHINVIEANGHPEDKVSVKNDTHKASCTADGFIIYHCDECNSDYRVNNEALGHNGEYLRTEKSATCTKDGEDIYFCNVCLEEYSVITNKVEHNWVDVEYKAASCGTVYGEDGNVIGGNAVIGNTSGIRCADCGEVLYGCEEINPHKYELIQTVTAATCETDGIGLFKCTECLIEEERGLQALGHTDADRNNICDVCGELAFTLIKKSAFTHISDINGLKAIADNPSGFYWLDNDIDLSDINWIPLGTENIPFKGIFYGNSHTISGLTINVSNTELMTCAGLFGYNKGQIVNLNISSFDLTVYNSSVVFGGIAAYNYGTILNCALTGENKAAFTVYKVITESKQTYVLEHDMIFGGIVGVNEQTGLIENCTVSGSIISNHTSYCSIETAANTIWQLIGQWMVQFIYETKVNTIQHITLGGIAGRNEGEIKTCAVTGQVMTESYAWANLAQMRGEAIAYTHIYAGALVGYNTGLVSNCSAKALIYKVKDEQSYLNIPDIIIGKTYKRGYWIYNYSKNSNAVEGIIGTNSSSGLLEGLKIL